MTDRESLMQRILPKANPARACTAPGSKKELTAGVTEPPPIEKGHTCSRVQLGCPLGGRPALSHEHEHAVCIMPKVLLSTGVMDTNQTPGDPLT